MHRRIGSIVGTKLCHVVSCLCPYRIVDVDIVNKNLTQGGAFARAILESRTCLDQIQTKLHASTATLSRVHPLFSCFHAGTVYADVSTRHRDQTALPFGGCGFGHSTWSPMCADP